MQDLIHSGNTVRIQTQTSNKVDSPIAKESNIALDVKDLRLIMGLLRG